MSFGGFIFLLVVAAICGSIGQSIAGYSLGGCFVSMWWDLSARGSAQRSQRNLISLCSTQLQSKGKNFQLSGQSSARRYLPLLSAR